MIALWSTMKGLDRRLHARGTIAALLDAALSLVVALLCVVELWMVALLLEVEAR